MPRRPKTLEFVGYIRVSSKRQADGNLSLAGQQDAIYSYSESVGRRLNAVAEDIQSAGGDPMKRSGLRDALNAAETLKCPILVTSIDRLSRNFAIYKILVSRGIGVSVAGEGKITRKELKKRLIVAQSWYLARVDQAAAAHASKSPEARKKSVPDLPDARRQGTLKQMGRANMRDLIMFRKFDELPELMVLSRDNLFNRLNAIGLLNIIDKSGRTKNWTKRSAADLRTRYRKHLKEIAEIENDDF